MRPPVTTFVTAFLNLHEDRSKDKSPETCFRFFGKLAATGIPIHAFVDPSYHHLLPPLPPTVTVVPLSLEDLEIAKAVQQAQVKSPIKIPQTATPHHDTLAFHTLINAKPELVSQVAKSGLYSTPQYAWIDFSIFHVLKDEEQAYHQLLYLAHTLFRPGVYLPGCWGLGTHADSLLTQVNWRFCGGFFLGDRASLEEFRVAAAQQVEAVLAAGHFVWEVNVWHRAELAGWRSQWYYGDHNNTILDLPASNIHVVAALTTIPPRLSIATKAAVESVRAQVSDVFLCCPAEYRRFGARPPTSINGVHVISGEDMGPATKYLGPAGADAVPAGAWILTIDDDQEYAADLVSKMLSVVRPGRPLGVYQNHYESIKAKTSGGLIHGYVGNLMPHALTDALPEFPLPEEAHFVDDQWMSAYCFRQGIPIYPTPLEQYGQIFRVLQNGHEKLGEASLSGLGNRDEKVRVLERSLGIRFVEGARWRVEEAPVTPPQN